MQQIQRSAVKELVAFCTTATKTKKVQVQGRDYYSLSYRYSGKVSLKVGDVELISTKNSITFMPKQVAYETEVIEDSQFAVVHFKLEHDIDFRNPAVLDINDTGVKVLFEKVIQSFRADSSFDFRIMAHFYELLARLESLTPLPEGKQIPRKIMLARETMLKCFFDPQFSVATLAEDVDVSGAYLRREFSRAYGKSPISFLKELRLHHARNLLQSEYLTIAQIAEQSGFSSVSYFIQVFHKMSGESPDRYRKRFYEK